MSCLLFVLFGLGAILITPLVLVLGSPERGQPIVRAAWRLTVGTFVFTHLSRIDRGNLSSIRGSVIAANHPSLVDVVFLTALIPRTLYVAKHALKGNPFLSAIVRTTALPDDETLPETAAPYLAKGWNVLIFPEGTRSPETGLHPFRRGAAQLALRAHAPIAAVGISVSRRVLAKGQRPWDMGRERLLYRFRSSPMSIPVAREGESLHAAAVRVTSELRTTIQSIL